MKAVGYCRPEPLFDTMRVPPRRGNVRGRGHHLAGGDDMAEGTCTIEGCEKAHYGHGWCQMHYRRWKVHGDVHRVDRIYGDPLARFWSKVDKRGPDECWEFRAAPQVGGYRTIRWDGRSQGAHRVAWMIANGPIPDGHEVCHSCDNPPCVNLGHLWLGTHADNIRDRDAKGRTNRGVGSKYGGWCGKRLHRLEGDNVLWMRNNRHTCRACKRASDAARHAREKGKR